jgi:hypothetical protein
MFECDPVETLRRLRGCIQFRYKERVSTGYDNVGIRKL